MIMPMPTMMRKAKNGMIGFGPVLGREGFQALDLAVPFMGEDQAAERRNRKLVMVGLGLGIGEREQDQRHAPLPVSQCASMAAILAG